MSEVIGQWTCPKCGATDSIALMHRHTCMVQEKPTSREERAKETYYKVYIDYPMYYKWEHVPEDTQKEYLRIADHCISKEVELLRELKEIFESNDLLYGKYPIAVIDLKIKEREA